MIKPKVKCFSKSSKSLTGFLESAAFPIIHKTSAWFPSMLPCIVLSSLAHLHNSTRVYMLLLARFKFCTRRWHPQRGHR